MNPDNPNLRGPRRLGDWILTYTGVHYYPADPRPEDVNIFDIAHALSLLCRYGGHCSDFYSVAEHSILVSYIVPKEFALEGLLHDGTEGVGMVDIPRPLKYMLPQYRELEELNRLAIAVKFELPLVESPEVKDADNRILILERNRLMPHAQKDWATDLMKLEVPTGVQIHCYPPHFAEYLFLQRFKELTNG